MLRLGALKLMTPGPVEAPREVLEALAAKTISHRSEEFRRLLERVTRSLARLAGAREALVLAGSGTTAVDAMVYSLVKPGSRVLLIEHGVFGRRMKASLLERGATVHTLYSRSPGEPVNLGEVMEELETGGYDYLAVVHNETSLGLAYRDLAELAERASRLGVRVLVDAVSSFGGEELRVDDWGVYAAATCSHKALASPPGVAIVLLSGRAVEELEENDMKGVPPVLDLASYHRFLVERRETPYTPPVNNLYALAKSLERIERMGPEHYIRAHGERARLFYKLMGESSLYRPVVADERYRSNTVAALWTQRAREAVEAAAERGYRIALGMGENREQMIRVGLMGDISLADVEAVAAALLANERGG